VAIIFAPGWHPFPDDPQKVRYWDGKSWSEPTSVEMAQLRELSQLNSKYGSLRKIAFRVGFLALLALLALIISLASVLAIPLALLG
jgi:hypothetical protein